MAIKELSCPKCGGSLEINEDHPIGFCPYCGTQIEFDDGANQFVKGIRSVGNVIKTKIETEKETKAKEMELAEERRKREMPATIGVLIGLGIFLVVMMGMLIMVTH